MKESEKMTNRKEEFDKVKGYVVLMQTEYNVKKRFWYKKRKKKWLD